MDNNYGKSYTKPAHSSKRGFGVVRQGSPLNLLYVRTSNRERNGGLCFGGFAISGFGLIELAMLPTFMVLPTTYLPTYLPTYMVFDLGALPTYLHCFITVYLPCTTTGLCR